MLFNSLQFVAFFATLYALYRVLPFRGQNWLLLLAGYFFYGCWDVRFLFLIAFSTTVDFAIGLMLGEGRVPARERLKCSVFLLLAAVLFVAVHWDAVTWTTAEGWAPRIDWARLIPRDPLGVAVVAGTAAFVALANVAHGRIAGMAERRRRKLLLFGTVFVNLTFLGFFKYFNFFVGSAEQALTSLGFDASLFRLQIILPVGISFYTFQSLSYTIDVYRGELRPVRRLGEFALFVAYFAPMVAGPIERARHLLPQLTSPRVIRLGQSMDGLFLILFGLFKKVAIADGLAGPISAVYGSTGRVGAPDVILATTLFAVQIYCDFSGYSDIARGVSKLLGIELALNFDIPYASRNPSEFWRRWHISLSTWLRDYLYVPLGGNRRGNVKTYRNLMSTMVLGGLWHGAAWNYVLWGFYQGVLLCVHRAFARRPGKTKGAAEAAMPPRRGPLAIVGTLSAVGVFFVFCCYGWLLFRAGSLAQIVSFTGTLFMPGSYRVPSVIPRPPLAALVGLPVLLLLQLVEYRAGTAEFRLAWPRPVRGAVYAVLLFVTLLGTSNAPAQFIYFQF